MSQDILTWMVLGGVFVALLMFVSFFRTLISGIFSKILTPGIVATTTVLMKWILYLMKRLMASHLLLIKNLLSPHSVVFPTLERRENGEKKMP